MTADRYVAGTALALAGAALSGLNGSLGRYLLDDGLSAWHFTLMRSVIGFAVLAGVLLVVRPQLLRIRRRDLGAIVVAGLAMTLAQAGYFFAVSRIDIAVALVLQYLYPLLILAWLQLGHGRALSRETCGAVAVALAGSCLVVGILDVETLDVAGVLAALGSAVAFAVYIVGGERLGDSYPAATTLVWSLGLASVLWLVVRPPWTFPADTLAQDGNLLIAFAVATVGTLLPFLFIVAAVARIPASRASILLVSEAVFGGAFAFVLHGERLGPGQIAGGLLVVASLVWLQLRRGDPVAEAAPRGRAAQATERRLVH